MSVAVCDDYIYAMGGFDGHIRQNTAERYLASKNQWSLIHPMHHQRSDASAHSLNGVYVMNIVVTSISTNGYEYYKTDSSSCFVSECLIHVI